MRKSLRLLPLIFICFASFINAQQLVISEFRTSGPGGSSDEFIEIYNPGVSDHLVTAVSGTGYGVATSDGITRASIPNGTLIRSKQHYLVVSSAYSLANYGGTGAAAGNTSYATDIPDNMGIAIFNNNTGGASYTLANRLDAVGSSTEANSLYKEGSGYTALSALNLESALRRKSYNAVPRDSDDNLSDFEFVDNLGTTNGSQQRLGAPGPENLNSPVSRNAAVVLTRLDQTAAALAQPNTFRDLATTGSINPLGTIEFRYRLTNNTGVPLTRIRLRLDSLTTLPAGVTKADLRAMTSSNITINAVNDPATCASTGSPATSPCSVPVMGTTLETPPAQPPGGGFNSTLTLSTIFSGSPLAAGASINIRLLFGVVKTGDYSISFTPEVLPYTAAIGPVPPPEKINGATGPTACTINQASGQSDPTSNSPVNFTVFFNGAVTGFTSTDVTLSGTAGATAAAVTETAPNDGTTYNVAVSGMTTNGTVIASIPAGVVLNSGNFGNLASSGTDNTVTYSLPSTGTPSVTIDQATDQADPTGASPINFTAIFSESITGFADEDVSLSGTAGATTAVVTEIAPNNGTTYNVAVSGMTTSGTVIASIPAGSAVSSANIGNAVSASTDNTVTFTVAAPDITVVKTANSATASVGEQVGYTITVTNIGGGSASDVTLTDILPAGLNWSISSQTATAFSITGTVNSQVLTGNIGTLAPAASTSVTITATAISPGTINNTATVSSSNEAADALANNTSTATITVAGPDITVVKTANSATASVGQEVGYTITVTNTSAAGSASDVTLSDILPAGLNWSISSQTATAFSITGTVNSQVLTGNIGTLAPVASTSVTITATAISPGTINNTATVFSSNEAADALANNTSTAIITIHNAVPPTLTCPANVTTSASVEDCLGTVDLGNLNYIITGDPAPILSLSWRAGNDPLAALTSIIVVPGASVLSSFPKGVTTITTTASNGALPNASCQFTVTVADQVPPVITCSANVSVNVDAGACTATISNAVIGTATAQDNCSGTVIITHSDFPQDNKFPIGTTTITWTATDAANNSSTCQQTIMVNDNIPPAISGVSANPAMLAPPNHKMKDVTIDYTVDDCSSVTNVLTVTANEGNDVSDYQVIDAHHVKLRAERNGTGDGRIYTVTITSTDGAGNSSVATIPVIVAHNVSSPRSGAAFRVGSTVNFAGTFWDIAGNKHTATWLIDNKTSIKGTVTEPSGMKNGTVAGSYKFTTPGVYKLQMNVTDQKGVTTYANTNGELEAIVVIYDPNGGYTYGGGWFSSPAGALKSDLNTTGNVSYGFVVNYYKGATLPRGETQFDFKLGEFEFNAVNFDYLSISGAKAQFKGSGKIIGGQSGIKFIMTVVDGNLDGTGIDKVRIKIYNKNSGKIYYDNQPGAGDTENPVTAVGSNSEVIVLNANATANLAARMNTDNEELTADAGTLEATVMPNPSRNSFYLSVRSNYLKDKITMQVTDMYGRIIEVRNILAGQTIQLGDRYRPGTYIVKLIQRNMHRQLKLVKLTE